MIASVPIDMLPLPAASLAPLKLAAACWHSRCSSRAAYAAAEAAADESMICRRCRVIAFDGRAPPPMMPPGAVPFRIAGHAERRPAIDDAIRRRQYEF